MLIKSQQATINEPMMRAVLPSVKFQFIRKMPFIMTDAY